MIAQHTLAKLTARVRVQPASLGSHFYYLEPGQLVRINHEFTNEFRCYLGEPKEPRISDDYFFVPRESLEIVPQPAPEFEPIGFWGEPGEKSLAIGPENGGVAVCEMVTTTGEGRFTEESAARGVKWGTLFLAASELLHALENIQANPNDPRAHRRAFDAIKRARVEPKKPSSPTAEQIDKVFSNALAKMDEEPAETMKRIFYVCPKCEEKWEEEYTSACDSECPKCGTENIEATQWEEIE